MKQFFKFIGLYSALWIVLSIVFKLIFIFWQFSSAKDVGFGELLSAIPVGLRMDISFTAYLVLFASVMWLFFFWKQRVLQICISIITYIVLFLACLLEISDLDLYKSWGAHIDATVLQYIITPSEAVASLSYLRLALLILLFLLSFIGFVLLYRRFVLPSLRLYKSDLKLKFLPIILVFGAFMALPIRGSVSTAPMNVGMVYFSENMLANHVAVNPLWNFIYSLGKLDVLTNQYTYMEIEQAQKIAQPLFSHDSDNKVSLFTNKRPNVIVVMMESFAFGFTKCLGNYDGITPNFDSLTREGVLFSSMYAASNRTDKGLVAVLCGYPAQPINSIIKFPQKTQRLPFISKSLKEIGYHPFFVYGGDKNFTNINSLLHNGGIADNTDISDFDASLRTWKWGVHDEYVFQRFVEKSKTQKQPFFGLILTQSNHEPYEVPGKKRVTVSGDLGLVLNSVMYADSCLGAFIKDAKQQSWWTNTVIVLVADHGSQFPNDYRKEEVSRYRIPMLLLGGALSKRDTCISEICNQQDIASTLLSQMSIETSDFTLCRNVLSRSYVPWAMYCFNDGFGFVADSVVQIYDNEAKHYLLDSMHGSAIDSCSAKAIWQYINDDFVKR